MSEPEVAPREALLRSIEAWAANNSAVIALILTGSLAREDGSSDGLSDIDIEIISNDPASFASDGGWISEIGELTVVLPIDASSEQRWPTRLAIYANGLKVDYTLAGLGRLEEMIAQQRLDELYARGFRVVLDKTGLTARLPKPTGSFPIRELPLQSEFTASIEEFWFEAAHIPKYLVRNELWVVKIRDHTMKERLLEMLEWHAVARNAQPVDVWHIGTKLARWSDTTTWDELQHTFGHLDAADSRKAFEATVALYGRLGREVAEASGLEYPSALEESILEMCAKTFSKLR